MGLSHRYDGYLPRWVDVGATGKEKAQLVLARAGQSLQRAREERACEIEAIGASGKGSQASQSRP